MVVSLDHFILFSGIKQYTHSYFSGSENPKDMNFSHPVRHCAIKAQNSNNTLFMSLNRGMGRTQCGGRKNEEGFFHFLNSLRNSKIYSFGETDCFTNASIFSYE